MESYRRMLSFSLQLLPLSTAVFEFIQNAGLSIITRCLSSLSGISWYGCGWIYLLIRWWACGLLSVWSQYEVPERGLAFQACAQTCLSASLMMECLTLGPGTSNFFFLWQGLVPGWPQTCHVAENDLELRLKFSFNSIVFVCMMCVSEHVWRSEDSSMEFILPPLHGFQAQVCSARTFTHRPQTLNFWSSCFYLLDITPGWQVVPLWLFFSEPGTEPWAVYAR